MIDAADLIAAARELVGVPWRHQGRSRSGVDCIGLVVLACANAGLDLFSLCGLRDRRNYGRKPDPALFELVRAYCTPCKEPIAGGLVLFRFPGDAHARHFALCTEAGTIIHAEGKSRQAVVEHGYRAQWLRWTDSRWLIPGVRYE